MPQAIPEPILTQLSKFVAAEMGLNFSSDRRRDLERGIVSAAHGGDAEAYAKWLLSAPLSKAQVETLASELTVGETYFFREKRGFDVLEETILPELIRTRRGGVRRLRIWSAGCCTGEEPYSIAILLDRLLPAHEKWHVTILATDINPRFLRKASMGVYGEWSFRNPPAWLKEGYFTAGKGSYKILDRIRERVKFDYLNLAEDNYPSLDNNTNAMDIIFCRNVLMYFAPELAGNVGRRFYRALMQDGWLIVSPSEVSSQIFPQFTSENFGDAILYRKGDKPLAETPRFPAAPAPVIADGWMHVEKPVFSGREPQEIEVQPLPREPVLEEEEGVAQPGATVEDMVVTARACANSGELAKALECADQAIAADRLNAGLHYLRATILQESAATEEAILSFQRAIYLDGDFVLAHFALGNMALHRQRSREAARHFVNTLGLLKRYPPEEVLPYSDGLVAGRLMQVVESMMAAGGKP